LASHPSVKNLHRYAVFQLNDTHPALAVPELLRLLCDRHQLDWHEAWSITRECFAYTNHTILPEALERWPVWLMERLLPRHLQLIYEINAQFLRDVREEHPGDEGRVQRLSLIEEGPERQVRMAHLAIVGSHRVNGVSELHSQIVRERIFRDFAEFYPGKFINQTNGVTPRRWLLKCNPELAGLVTELVGSGWETDLGRLESLVPYADDAEVQKRWGAIKRRNKERFADYLKETYGLALDPSHLVDSHVKRIHEYKRQLLNVVHVVSRYLQLRAEPTREVLPRTFVFSGKAAPGYAMAKRIIHLINAVAAVVNGDELVRRKLHVLFVPNYGVSIAELIIPASDVSEQISTAGTEASGTGNMKFALNGALTIGTLDGANIEIKAAVGAENMFLFGLTADEVRALQSGYDPRQVYLADRELSAALDAIASGLFSPDDPGCFRPIIDSLLHGGDPYMVLADFRSYASVQRTIEHVYRDSAAWTRKSILNVARMGYFSSDRSVAGYARDVWGLSI
jgi:starch phosphorylase